MTVAVQNPDTDLFRKALEALKARPKPCPTCGACPTCGPRRPSTYHPAIDRPMVWR